MCIPSHQGCYRKKDAKGFKTSVHNSEVCPAAPGLSGLPMCALDSWQEAQCYHSVTN